MGKIIRRTLTALLIVIFALSAAIVGAKIQMYTATGEDYANEVESQDIAKLRARDKAIKKATKQAGVYLKSYSRSVNSELTDDEVTAITSNAWQLVGEPKYSSKIVKGSDETSIIIWTATVEVNVDDSEIQSWIKRDDKDKSTIITQTREAQKASEENERKIEDLREKYNRVTSQAERDSIIKQMNDADREFLANQKAEEGDRLAYKGNLAATEKFYTEAIDLVPSNANFYERRGGIYSSTISLMKHNIKDGPRIQVIRSHGNDKETYYKLALADFDKAIELKPNEAKIYAERGFAHYNFEKYHQALKDYDTALSIDTKCAEVYIYKNMYYRFVLKDNKLALANLNDAIELNQNNDVLYSQRSLIYKADKKYDLALADINKAIGLNNNTAFSYYLRGDLYLKLGNYDNAIKDAKRALELNPDEYVAYFILREAHEALGRYDLAIEDYNQIIKDHPDTAIWYYLRGKCYEKLGETTKAKADFAKAKQLGYNG